MTNLITEAREQAQRRSLSLATRDLLNGLCDALEKAEERGQGCEHCRGWDKRCGANYCPMCGKRLEEHHEAD